MSNHKKLGEILVEKGILTPKSVSRTLEIAKRQKKRFGMTLEDMELVTGEELAEALAQQHNLKLVSNLSRYSYPRELFEIISSESALQQLVFPLKLDGNKLGVAMADPTDMRFLNNLGINKGYTIIPFVATRKDIHAAICKHYFGKEVEKASVETILVIEDDEFMRTFLREILTRHGYQVVLARDGMEGFREVIVRSPQIIISDKEMPKFDGFALINSLRALPETSSIPVILISGIMTPDDETTVFDKGFFDFIRKPVSESTLISRVKRALRFCEQRRL